MKKVLVTSFSAMALAGFLGSHANAALITYSDNAAWSAALNGTPTTVTIPDPSPDPFAYFGAGTASVTYDGVVFSTSSALSDGTFYNIGVGQSGLPAVLSSQQQTTGVANILITLPAPVTALSLDYGTLNGNNVAFLLSNGDTITQGSTGYAGDTYAVPDFFGATDSTPFTSVLLTAPDAVLDFNNLIYSAAVVPEPASMALLGFGLAGLGAFRRRRTTA